MSKVDHSENVVEVDRVGFAYNSQPVLTDITLRIHRGDYWGLVGPNGAGKTTLLKIMLGLLKPDSGTVRLFGRPLADFKSWPKIGYVPQKANFDPNFPATVFEVVLMGRYGRRGLGRRLTNQDKTEAKRALSWVEMDNYGEYLIGDLSGGQQQRVFIARALAGEPEIIFLDEPTAGIDLETRDEFYRLLKKLNQELDLTLVLVSHDLERVVKEVMHLATIEQTLTFYNSPEDFLKLPK